ncbi:MAG TPA: hypothetical protein VE988_12340 [Gemmataceae bacterium]|nr:hypothetical protein [Gemmataceae bacterium]
MIYPTRPPVHPRLAPQRDDDVDGLLSRFFRSELPEPWPTCPTVSAAPNATVKSPWKSFLRFPVRVAVAAAVAGLVIGYAGLQRWFPDPKPVAPMSMSMDSGNGMAIKLPSPGPFIDHTKNGVLVRGDVIETPDPKKFNLRVEELPAKKQ